MPYKMLSGSCILFFFLLNFNLVLFPMSTVCNQFDVLKLYEICLSLFTFFFLKKEIIIEFFLFRS